MIPFKTFLKQIESLPQDQVETILEIHNIVGKIKPQAAERFDRYGITYYDPSRGGPVRAGICQILFEADHLRLAFIHGKFIPDPLHLLQGDLLAKRHMVLRSFESVPWEAVTDLITAHAVFDPLTLPQNSPKRVD